MLHVLLFGLHVPYSSCPLSPSVVTYHAFRMEGRSSTFTTATLAAIAFAFSPAYPLGQATAGSPLPLVDGAAGCVVLAAEVAALAGAIATAPTPVRDDKRRNKEATSS